MCLYDYINDQIKPFEFLVLMKQIKNKETKPMTIFVADVFIFKLSVWLFWRHTIVGLSAIQATLCKIIYHGEHKRKVQVQWQHLTNEKEFVTVNSKVWLFGFGDQ